MSKETPAMDLASLVAMAQEAGYDGICMRASQLGVHSPEPEIRKAAELLASKAMPVTMVTGDFDIVYNNERGPDCLRHIGPFLRLAQRLHAPMVRVALKTPGDIPWAQKAAVQAENVGLKLVHQCHTRSLFETLDGIEATLRKIDRPNFGLIYEPANLELCGQPYGPPTLERLARWVFNVYLQNQRLNPAGAMTLQTACRGPVRFDLISIHDHGGLDFAAVFQGLEAIEYDGPITVHQSARQGESPLDSANRSADYLRRLIPGLNRNG